jgi:hypothetical protein
VREKKKKEKKKKRPLDQVRSRSVQSVTVLEEAPLHTVVDGKEGPRVQSQAHHFSHAQLRL